MDLRHLSRLLINAAVIGSASVAANPQRAFAQAAPTATTSRAPTGQTPTAQDGNANTAATAPASPAPSAAVAQTPTTASSTANSAAVASTPAADSNPVGAADKTANVAAPVSTEPLARTPAPSIIADPAAATSSVAPSNHNAALQASTTTVEPAAPVTPTLEQRLEAVEKQSEAASHLKFSGYVQAQFVHSDTSSDAQDATGKPLNRDLFEIRRARLRATYTLGIAEFLLNIDAIPAGVSVKEAEASLTIPWSDTIKTKITAGLFYIPFGYEVQESDSVLPFVERTMAANRLFPGSRDVGVRIAGDLFDQKLVYQLAVMNGNPVSDAVLPGSDPNAGKDVVGRIGAKFGGLRAGVSGLMGTGYVPPVTADDPATPADERHRYLNFAHRAAALDITFTANLPVIGELALYAEGVLSHNLDRSKLTDYPKVSNGTIVGSNQAAGYLGFTQHLGEYVALGARAEVFDPNVDVDHNTLSALTLVGHVFPAAPVRLTTAYQFNWEKKQVANNLFWLRAQVKF